MSWTLELRDLAALSVGAAILGGGGGGDPYIGRVLAEAAMRKGGPVTMLDVEEVPEDAWVLPTSMMGAPTVMQEKLPGGNEAVSAFLRLEQHLGIAAYATLASEVGGVNLMVPLIVASALGRPVVDADGMGRSFPELYMQSFHIYGVEATPACIASEHGDFIILDRLHDDFAHEWLARGVTQRMGGHAFIADYPMRGLQLRRAAIRGTVGLALRLGRALLSARRRQADPLEALCQAAKHAGYGRGAPLFEGKVVEVLRWTRESFAQGTAAVEGLGEHAGAILRVDFQNENLLASRNGLPVCTVPDIIVILDDATGLPVATEEIRYGQRVRVLGIPVPAAMTTAEALDVWGPRGFGYDADYASIC